MKNQTNACLILVLASILTLQINCASQKKQLTIYESFAFGKINHDKTEKSDLAIFLEKWKCADGRTAQIAKPEFCRHLGFDLLQIIETPVKPAFPTPKQKVLLKQYIKLSAGKPIFGHLGYYNDMSSTFKTLTTSSHRIHAA